MQNTDYETYMRQRAAMIAAIRANQAAQAQQESEPQTESDRAHLFSGLAGVLLPLAQAVITGLLFGLAAWIYAGLLKAPEAWRYGAGVAAGVFVISWLAMLARWLSLTRPLDRLERLTGIDINGDGLIADQPKKTIRVEFKAAPNQTIIADLPYTNQAMQFYSALIRGDRNGIHQWTGRNKPLTPGQYEQIRDELLERNFARWIGDPGAREGWELTPYGRSALKAIMAPSPTLPENDL